MTKVCSKCSQSKPMDDFYDRKANSDGKQGRCKECMRQVDRDRARERYANDPEYRKARYDQRFEGGEHWAYAYTVRCKKFGVTPVVSQFSRQAVIDEYGDQCFYCQRNAFEELDHFTPVSQGGPHTLDNVRPSCTKCNRVKRDSDPLQFAASSKNLDWSSGTTKVCTKCFQHKSLDNFHSRKTSKDGKQGTCKECKYDLYKERYANDPEYRQRKLDYARHYSRENRKAQQPEPV